MIGHVENMGGHWVTVHFALGLENHCVSSSGLSRTNIGTSLNSYDLGRLFAARPVDSRAGGGEALGEDSGGLCAASDPASSCGSSGSAGEEAAMTDSLATLDWDTDTNDGDDESRD